MTSWWDSRRTPSEAPAAAAPAVDVSSRLASLAELHSQGKLTDEEYAAAKAQVLGGS
jgi:putative oligomerization/nucleic acid binding protein